MQLCSLPTHLLPLALLLEADPNEAAIARYLEQGIGYAAMEGKSVLGVCVVQTDPVTHHAEIMNLAVSPARQNEGIGRALLGFVLEQLAELGMTTVTLGTGSFGYQLTFYQRFGFRVTAVWPDHFLHHYPAPIMEQGVQLRDMLRLTLTLPAPAIL